MIFTAHDIKQIDYEYLANLPVDKLLNISFNFLQDLKEAHDRFNQTPLNSSRPPASFPPWQAKPHADSPNVEENLHQGTEKKETGNASAATVPTQKNEHTETTRPAKEAEKKKPGKQVGAQGHGRQVSLPVTDIQYHRACECAACSESLSEDSLFIPRTGLYVLDVEVEELGLKVSHVKHLYGDTHCACGHITRTEPGRCEKEEGWDVELTEWHLAGPTLVSLIICLALRMRLPRRPIQEFLHDWLGIWLSIVLTELREALLINPLQKAGERASFSANN